MKYIFNFVSSTKLTIILLITLITGMGVATFIENTYDTNTARYFVYNALWFEFLLLLLAVNFIGHIQKHNLFSKKKAALLVFHLAFIIMILGAGITRYISYEGMMHIREGESSNIIFGSQPYLSIMTPIENEDSSYDIPINMSKFRDNSFHASIKTDEKGVIDVDFKDFIENATEKIVENVPDGINMIELIYALQHGNNKAIYLKEGEVKDIENISIAYNNNERQESIKIIEKDGKMNIISPFDIIRTRFTDDNIDTILKFTQASFEENVVYNTQGVLFLNKKSYKNAKKQLVSRSESDEQGKDALIIDITINDKEHEINVFGGSGYSTEYQTYSLDGYELKVAYGVKSKELPFSIFLNDFILERYPGSKSPSSFASEVTVFDKSKGVKKDYRIFMNNILNYGGYRFFQSSYDSDERGTILSVNHDFYGTWVSYLGYFMLGVGFLLTLFSKNSRFLTLSRNIKELRNVRKAGLIVIIILGLNSLTYSNGNSQKPVDDEHVSRFGQLIVQTYDGRFAPLHTLAYDVMHKISRKDKFEIEGIGKMDGIQVFHDMFVNEDFWKSQKIIYVRDKTIRNIIEINSKYASYDDFFNQKQKYKLAELSEKAFRKKPTERNKFDKEIIRVDERVNICLMVFNGSLLRIFPEQGSENNKWIHCNEKSAFVPLTGSIKMINDDLQLEVLNYHNFLKLYLQEVRNAKKSSNYSRADKILGYIESIQRGSASGEVLPSKSKVNLEIYYNKAQIYIKLKTWYASLSGILLLLAFIVNLKSKKSKILNLALYFFVILLGLAFLYHSYGMGLRWYLTGHAPWSNGYEALILVAWGGLLAGFCFMRYSKITLAATALLAFFTLMTASHSSYDPQLTNLQPVLKSYWLIIHVACMTVSYGFLGLGFILGLINLFIHLFKTGKNAKRLGMIIKENTYINEMTLTIGLVLATIGCFLGAVWANESWGRYWGWDPKETWALIIIIIYAIILHFRLIPKLKSEFIFTIASIIGFGSVIMTFIGVNYYFSKGMHSYASSETPVFPIWAWITILLLIILIVGASVKEKLSTTKGTT